nr:hypothetical protein [Actinomadura sp. NAK00032]
MARAATAPASDSAPLPGEALGHGAAHHRSGDDREPGEPGEQAERLRPVLRRMGGAEQRHRQWHHQGGTGALHRPRADQPRPPGFAMYLDGRAFAVQVLTLRGPSIAAVTAFHNPALLDRFALPQTI